LSRRLARDRLHAGDVRLYDAIPQSSTDDRIEIPECISAQTLELESLDLVKMGPYLILIQAHEMAEQIISEAKSEADTIREQSRLSGVAQGREEAKQEVLPGAVALANAAQALIVFEEQMITRYTPEMVRLALEIAEKIVHKVVTAEPETIASILDGARQEVTEARRIRICLNPRDYELLAEIRADLLMLRGDAGRTIEVVADEELTRGGCRLETEIGIVDATLPTQISELSRYLLDEEKITTASADSISMAEPRLGMGREL
jgi:flagellar assembly protein FliH